jgi:hypothetical protein
MYVDFDNLSNDSRLWIYQASNDLNKAQIIAIEAIMRQFTENWEAHQHPLQASYQILFDRFIILAVNGTYHEPSGCSIDKSVAVIKQIEQEVGVQLFDRLNIAYLEGDKVKSINMKELKEKIAENEFSPETFIFNNAIQTKGEMERNWKIQACQSWLSRYFSIAVAS